MPKSTVESGALLEELVARNHERAAMLYESWMKGRDDSRDDGLARRARASRALVERARSPERLAERALEWLEARVVAGHTSPDGSASLRTLAVLERLRALVDERIAECVAASRDEGATWAQIAAALRMRRQSAHQRFASSASPDSSVPR